MQYITNKEYKEAGADVLFMIKKWYKPQAGDVVETCDGKAVFVSEVINGKAYFSTHGIKNFDYNIGIMPMLTAQQLIDFIEWRTNYKINKIEYGAGDMYWVEPYIIETYGMDEEIPRWVKEEKSFCDENLLIALWKCACEVATDKYYDIK